MIDNLEAIIKNAKDQQECVRQILLELQVICRDLEIDFDLALLNAEPEIKDMSQDACDHKDAMPDRYGYVYCQECSTYLVKSRSSIPVTPLVEQNLWRPNG